MARVVFSRFVEMGRRQDWEEVTEWMRDKAMDENLACKHGMHVWLGSGIRK